jgi:hypothetical protein
LSSTIPPTTFFGVVKKKANIRPVKIKAAKITSVLSHPNSTNEYLVNTGETK